MAKYIKILILLCFLSRVVIAQENTTRIISSEPFTKSEELWDLVGMGISNFEVDIMYIYGELYVTKSMPDSANHTIPNFSDAYLFPLYSNFKKNDHAIIPGDERESFIILNIQNEFKKTNSRLKAEVGPLKDLITYYNGTLHKGAIRLLVKNENFRKEISKDGYSCLGLVGNMNDINSDLEYNQMPLIEVNFEELTSWNGVGNIPFSDFVKIKDIVNRVHQKGRSLSVINCPNNKATLDALISAKVDFINTNDPRNTKDHMNNK